MSIKINVHKLINWIREDRWRIAGALLWVFLFVRYQGVRDFFLGFFKVIACIWLGAIALVLAMIVLAIVAVIVMFIGVKIGVLPKDYITIKIKKRREKQEML